MKKILIFIIVLVILAGLGYVGFKFFWPSKNTSGGPPKGVQLCDIDAQTCSVIPKSANSGILQITINNTGKPVGDLEVDVGTKPGATKYYMGLTDANGVIAVDGIPAGSYFIYFNNGNFPTEFGNPPLVPVSISTGQTTKKTIDLTSK
jgi:hypothetical protein